MPSETVIQQLREFVNGELLEGAADDLDPSTPLLELGVLDSLSMVSLLAFIDEKYGVSIPEEKVLPEHFETLTQIAELIESLNGGSETTAKAATDELAQLVALQESYGLRSVRRSLGGARSLHSLETDGEGPTWLLLPALGNPSTAWSPVLRTIQTQQRAVAIDLAGFGLSSCETEAPTYQDHVEMVLATVNGIEGPLVVIGNSAGVPLATELARQEAERVDALVITGFGLIEDVDAWWSELEALSASPEEFMRRAYHRPPKLTPALHRLLADTLARPAYTSFLDDEAKRAMRTAFDDVRVPTLFVQGESDRIIPREAVERAAKRIPGAQVEWLARCGHFAASERPEPFLWFVQQFLSRLDAR